jgi:dTDP-4-amino-4,6-dideoxygalactose transaminase
MKEICGLDDLAVFGGFPAFAASLHVGQPNVVDEEAVLDLIRGALRRRQLTNNGPLVRQLEESICAELGVKHCVMMCNGTLALEIAVRALKLQGEIIVPSFTFIATAHSVQWQQLTPVFCDVDATTHCIDPGQIERLITPRTSAIIGVHLWGNPCAIEELQAVADRYSVELMFDASHAFGCSYKGRMIGNFGRAEVFSFHATKFINSFEGGAVVTNEDDLAMRMRFMRNFGFSGLDQVDYIGTNGKLCEPSAAMGLVSLSTIEKVVDTNRRNYHSYLEVLRGVTWLRVIEFDESERCNFQYIVLEIDAGAPISRDGLVEVLHAENIRARRYFWPGCHRMEPYRSLYPNAGLLLPQTEALSQRVLCLPTGMNVSSDDVEQIAHLVVFALEHGAEIERLMKTSLGTS